MAMNDALQFITDFRSDSSFRSELYDIKTPDEFSAYLDDCGYSFTDEEYADSIRSLVLRAYDGFEASEIRELGMWYKMLRGLV